MPKIEITEEPPFAWVTIQRPGVRNAFDGETLTLLAETFRSFEPGKKVRVAFLRGGGGFFSAGADLNWMRGETEDGEETFRESSLVLADALAALSGCRIPTVALVEKGALGGAVGLVAACDFAVATEDSRFRTSEVRLGLVPAVIGPYVVQRIGERAAREIFLMAEFVDAPAARRLGLVNRVVPTGELKEGGTAFARPLVLGGPHALAAAKRMLADLPGLGRKETLRYTADLIAKLRASPEGQEGMSAFLEKRKPSWRGDDA